MGEFGTVGCVSGSRNSKLLCGSNGSLSHNFGRENLKCFVDVCFSVPNLGGSVVSDGGDTRPASGTPGYVLNVRDTKQTFFSQPEGIMSGAQPVVSLCHLQHQTLILSPL